MAKHVVCTSNLAKTMLRSHVPIKRLARSVGVTQDSIRKYMRGESDPNVYTALLIAEALLCDVSQLWSVEIIEVEDLTE